MYVCICNGHRDSDIRGAAEEAGLRCPREIYSYLGKPARCGRCLDFASKLIEEVHGQPPEPVMDRPMEVSKVA